ncbi:hypothetical protein MSIMFB_03288 [Mycobacterium simulans]|uniref:Integral membrane protein n=1 Tax=Mycobacterium simulans TaxID=627089 RepID=A0A7Z7ILJ9_9MYCO|nr:hypothetical protein [Mycobacterium simulans]SOJ55809.1 hypothetical protein MSIMFB_03288 [Mycobacterium simulans]
MNVSLRRALASPDSPRAAAEAWFLQRGLPSVLTRRARWRRLWPRSAPMLAAYATVHCWALPVLLITHGDEVVIDGAPTPREWALLALVAAAPALITFVGWLVSRLSDNRKRSVAATIAVSIVAIIVIVQTSISRLPDAAFAAVLLLLLTASGIGSVAGWSVRMMLSHIASIGTLAVRALPVVLLTTLVFFNGNVWLMSATISGERLTLAMVFLMSIAAAFVVSATVERVRPMLRSPAAVPTDCEELANTPFEAIPDPLRSPPLTRVERVNVVFVLAASQLAQILVVAALTTAIYVILGLIVLTPALLKEWAHTGSSSSTVLGLTVPVPDSLIHLCLFLGALTFMYISARAAGDADYRSTFVDPLIHDLHATLTARNRYRGNLATSSVDAGNVSD